MQTNIDEVIHVRLEGPLATLLAKVNPQLYNKYLESDRKGKPVMYVKLKKALYGTLQAAMLFWKDLTLKLKRWGYEINPYDWCVANKMVSGAQCTVVWHVDDLKISHVDPTVVESLLDLLDGGALYTSYAAHDPRTLVLAETCIIDSHCSHQFLHHCYSTLYLSLYSSLCPSLYSLHHSSMYSSLFSSLYSSKNSSVSSSLC